MAAFFLARPGDLELDGIVLRQGRRVCHRLVPLPLWRRSLLGEPQRRIKPTMPPKVSRPSTISQARASSGFPGLRGGG
jgi:hypothetical protein